MGFESRNRKLSLHSSHRPSRPWLGGHSDRPSLDRRGRSWSSLPWRLWFLKSPGSLAGPAGVAAAWPGQAGVKRSSLPEIKGLQVCRGLSLLSHRRPRTLLSLGSTVTAEHCIRTPLGRPSAHSCQAGGSEGDKSSLPCTRTAGARAAGRRAPGTAGTQGLRGLSGSGVQAASRLGCSNPRSLDSVLRTEDSGGTFPRGTEASGSLAPPSHAGRGRLPQGPVCRLCQLPFGPCLLGSRRQGEPSIKP